MNWPLLQNSLLVAGITTALAVGFGFVAALWTATLGSRLRTIVILAAIIAVALPPFLVTNCWIDLLGETGVLCGWLPFRIYSLGGTIWILALLLWPITMFVTLAAWRRLEAAHLECEPALTGNALLRWLLIPVARGELALAALLTFVLSLNNFSVPAILQTKVLPDEMWIRFNTQFDTLGALKLCGPLVIAPMLLLLWVTRRGVGWPRLQGMVAPEIFRRQLGSIWRNVCGLVAALICAISAILPVMQIVTAKRTWAELAGAVEASTSAIWNSFWFATVAATVVVGLGIILHRKDAETQRGEARQNRLASAATWASWLMFFIPGVLIGIALIKIFNRPTLVMFYQSAGICVLALAIRYFALAATATRHAITSVDSDLTDAAKLEGASHWQLFRFVIWPQIAPQVLAAWYVVYLLCLWDVESIVLVQPPGGETLALKIFNLLHYGYAAQVNALCLVLLAVAAAPLLIWSGVMWAKRRSTKRQTPSSRESSSINLQSTVARSGFENLNPVFSWMLALGVWMFCSGCSPNERSSEAALRSQFFSRAIVIGARGVGIGEFNKPRSLACDTEGNVYAVDMTGRVQKFTPDGNFLRTWQMPETELGKAKGMGRDPQGNIIVIEPHYQRVNNYTPDGTLVAQWGCRGTNEGCFILPRAVAVNSRGEYFISEYMGQERVQRFEVKSLGETFNTLQLTPNSPDVSRSPANGKQEHTNWPYAKSDTPLVALSQQPAGSEAGAPRHEAKLLQVIGRAGRKDGEFNRPEGICVDAEDRLYVADSCNHRIQIFAADGTFLRAFGKAGSSLGELSYPYDVAVDAVGNIFVCEFGNSRIQVFDLQGRAVEIIGGAGSAPGQFNNPWAIALDAHGNLYVADALNHRLQKLVRKKPVAAEAARQLAARPDAQQTAIATN